FEKDQILKAKEKTEEMERDTILLGDFLKQNDAVINKDFGSAVNIQLNRMQESIQQAQGVINHDPYTDSGSVHQKKAGALYSMTAVQVLNEEASSAHDEL
ncbi:hypothetical protein RFI_29313, partial [Reticulomyxa filosa]